MIPVSLSRRALAELLLLGAIWGASFLSIRIALDEVGVLSSVVHRVGWAALVLLVLVRLSGHRMPRTLRLWGAFAVMGLLNNILPFSLMAWGQLHIETGLTSILNAATAIWGALAAALCFVDERLSWRRGLGITIGFAGVVAIIGPGALAGFDITSLAQLAVILGTVSYAAASVWARAHLSSLPPLVAAAGMLIASTVMLVPITLLAEGSIDLPDSPRGAIAIAYYSLVATAFAYLLYYRILGMAGAGGAMLVTLLIPPIAIGLGALILGERLAPSAFAGLTLLAAGLLILSGGRARRNRAASTEAEKTAAHNPP